MKDPAFLFYSGDFKSATELMTDEEVGIYIRLICTQHQHGSIEKEWLEEKSKGSKRILKMFITDEDGSYYNESIRSEIQRRKNYSESRRANKLKKSEEVNSSEIISKTHEEHMTLHMETETETRTKDITRKKGVVKTKSCEFTLEDAKKFAAEKGYNEKFAENFFIYYRDNDWRDRDGKLVTRWKAKMNVWISMESNDKYRLDAKINTKAETSEKRYWDLIELGKSKPMDNNRFTYDERKFIIACQQTFDRFPPDERKLLSETSSLFKTEIDEFHKTQDAQWTV
jgi:hypothetical protein